MSRSRARALRDVGGRKQGIPAGEDASPGLGPSRRDLSRNDLPGGRTLCMEDEQDVQFGRLGDLFRVRDCPSRTVGRDRERARRLSPFLRVAGETRTRPKSHGARLKRGKNRRPSPTLNPQFTRPRLRGDRRGRFPWRSRSPRPHGREGGVLEAPFLRSGLQPSLPPSRTGASFRRCRPPRRPPSRFS